ncbi:uroporphyrinogen-III synthase [Methylomonas sp. EFPC3]|nr:uroporphyrinogen-III synthase [Methylomonas sp. EFPC3]WFP48868.1 uroporphyrinogen-III synthase [Methylomonas sp. EFPC3]
MMPGLNGARVLVTRPAGQAEHLCELIESRGGIPVRFPTLLIVAHQPEAQALADAAASDWLIFTSSNAVDFAIPAFGGKMPGWRGARLAAVGAATAQALRQAGCEVACVPASEFSSDGLLAEPALQQVAGLRCTIVRGCGGREKLADGLRGRGAEVMYLEVYSRSRPEADAAGLRADLQGNRLAAVTVTSVEALQNLLAMLDSESVERLRQIGLVVVSERIGQTALQLGFKRVAVSSQATDAAILETLTTLLNGENSGGSN